MPLVIIYQSPQLPHLYLIIRSQDEDGDIKAAQDILKRLQKRQLYSFCGQVTMCEKVQRGNCGKNLTADQIREEISEMGNDISEDDFFVNVTYIGVGKGKNPIDKVRVRTYFYSFGKQI